MMIAGDKTGKIVVVDFAADPSEADTIALPNAGSFGVQSSYVTLEKALGGPPQTTCGANYSLGFCGTFAMSDGTAMIVQFEGPGDGQLHRATWATPETLSILKVVQPTVSPAQ